MQNAVIEGTSKRRQGCACGKVLSKSWWQRSRLTLRLQVQPYKRRPPYRRRPFSVPHTSWYSPTYVLGRVAIVRPATMPGLSLLSPLHATQPARLRQLIRHASNKRHSQNEQELQSSCVTRATPFNAMMSYVRHHLRVKEIRTRRTPWAPQVDNQRPGRQPAGPPSSLATARPALRAVAGPLFRSNLTTRTRLPLQHHP